MNTRLRFLIIPFMAAGLAACGSDAPADDTAAADADPAAAQPPAAPPIDDPAVAEEGAQLFVARACPSCHTYGGGRLVGPDLEGVTERRSREWIVHMIMRPDSMVQADSTARALFAEYMTPMANQNLTLSEATALYAYLAREDGS